MIRVNYRWRVDPENFSAFRKTWRETTNRIQKSVPGALGSFMLRASEEESEILTVARWDSLEAWKKFWGNQNPEQMQGMGRLGTRISVEAFEEIEDHTR